MRERSVTALTFDEGIRTGALEGGPIRVRERRIRLLASACRALAASLAAALMLFAVRPCAADPNLIKIAVFDFELDDRSAGGGIIAQDAIDTENLRKSTEE